ncbi:MAG: DUF4154 domain-containing protein, partial [Pseudomonadales bacterium]|nr:DUF4154 domain-containing protein [Pseudomonadales bacterium]
MIRQLSTPFIAVCVFSWLLALPAMSWAKTPASQLSAGQAKALLLYNFIKHTQWPDQDSKKVISVAFLKGDEEFFKAFAPIANEARIKRKPVSLHKLENYKAAKNHDVLVMPQQYNSHIDEISSYLSHTETLLISDQAQNRSAVMINFIKPREQKLSFEVNRSNIIFEGMNISKDILLYGGSEIEVATLYKEMEKSLIQSKARLIRQEVKLLAQQETLRAQAVKIESKTLYIETQKKSIEGLYTEQSDIQILLDKSAQQLYLSQSRVDGVQKRLLESRKLSMQLTDQINTNADILSVQKQQIQQQSNKIGAQNQQLGVQESVIANQRSLILVILSALLLVTLYIIFRQKIALGNQRAITAQKTEIVRNQEASIDAYKSSLQVKNDFLTAINHELRTPMHLIMGALHDISADDKNTLQHSLGIVEEGAEQMMVLISDILFYSEIQSDALQIQTSSVDIKYQLIEACEGYRPDAEAKGLGFYVHFSRSVPDYLNVDVEHLCMVIEKLLDNAVKFTEQGEIVINVDWKVSQGPQLHIQIDDTGIGFSDDELERVFQPFEQSDAGLSRQHGGLGIGLSISEKLMSLMHGEISIVSDEHKGSSIHLTLPAPKAVQHKPYKEIPVAKVAKTLKPQKTNNVVSALRLAIDNTKKDALILIVEDNAFSQ